jgi:hypothetical protein
VPFAWYKKTGQGPFHIVGLKVSSRDFSVYIKQVKLIFQRLIAQSVWRQAMSWTAQIRFLVLQDFSLHRAQTKSWNHSTSYPMGIGIKRPGLETDHSPPSSAEGKETGAIPPLPHMSSCYSAKLIKHNVTYRPITRQRLEIHFPV